MAKGPGKYDALATYCRKRSNAETVVVLVLGGDQGAGCAVQSIDPEISRSLPALLRKVADDIEADTRDEDIHPNPRSWRQ